MQLKGDEGYYITKPKPSEKEKKDEQKLASQNYYNIYENYINPKPNVVKSDYQKEMEMVLANKENYKDSEWYKNNIESNSYQRHYEAQQKFNEAIQDTVGGSVNSKNSYYADNYYSSAKAALEKAYEQARRQAGETKQDTISAAYDRYLRATQSYGVEAENLASSGMSAKGGYGQLLGSNRFNAYANMENTANKSYAEAVNNINMAESSGKVDLEFQKYQEAMAEKQNEYNNQLQQQNAFASKFASAQNLAGNWAKYDGNKLSNETELRNKLKSNFDLNNDYVDAIINGLMNK